METFWIRSLLMLIILISSCGGDRRSSDTLENKKLKALEQLVDTQRETGKTLTEIMKTQNSFLVFFNYPEGICINNHSNTFKIVCLKEDKLKTLNNDYTKLSSALDELVGRLGIIETKIDTQAKEMENKLEDMRLNYTKVLQRLKDLEPKEPGSAEELTIECQSPFEPVGKDCVHWDNKAMTWENARRHCQDMDANLFIPTIKEGFELDHGTRDMSDPYPPLVDFLYEKLNQESMAEITSWIGAYVDDDEKVTWTSEEELKRKKNSLELKLNCIAINVANDTSYKISESMCNWPISTPLCRQQQAN